ncbi:hypothetical protein JB92DRAFT_3122532 [Gautieria morchelliformis]|nr:hypothetical protein JB92DRAFT_3122532 [Gautieria morchelliformis]
MELSPARCTPPVPPISPNFRPKDDRALDLVAGAMPSLGADMARTLDDYLNYAPAYPAPYGHASPTSFLALTSSLHSAPPRPAPSAYVEYNVAGAMGGMSLAAHGQSPPRQAHAPLPHPNNSQRSPDPDPGPADAGSLPTVETLQVALAAPRAQAPTPFPSSATSCGSSTAPSPSTHLPRPRRLAHPYRARGAPRLRARAVQAGSRVQICGPAVRV